MIKYFYLTDSWDPKTTTTSQSGHESNSNEGVLHIPKSSRTGASSTV